MAKPTKGVVPAQFRKGSTSKKKTAIAKSGGKKMPGFLKKKLGRTRS